MELRLLRAALWRKRGTVSIAVAAVAIGGSVACALLHVSNDVSRKLNHELRALGPNLIVSPVAEMSADAARWLDEDEARYRVSRTGVKSAALLLVSATHEGRPLSIVGADLEAVRQLHPSWRIGAGEDRTHERCVGPHAPMLRPSVLGKQLQATTLPCRVRGDP